jgi:DNA processing protein
MKETEAFVILNSIPYLGISKIKNLIEKFGSAANVLKLSPTELGKISGFERVIPHWDHWHKNSDWQKDLDLIEKFGVQLIPFTSMEFPKSLLATSDHPVLLYVQGQLKPQDQRSIAIIGTRHASIYGNEMAHQISKELAYNGFTVISGLARGIDTSSHQGALETGRTIAVIGSGLSNIYPPENRSLAREIIRQGALISEFSMMTSPDRQNFPQRNRIVSGMTMATLLIEAPLKSGAMITMDKAFMQKRKLFALPGRADNENFRGNHYLIKSGKAHLIENASDIMSHFDTLFPMPSQKMETKVSHLNALELHLLEKMTNEEIGIDALVSLTNLSISQVQTSIMGLILKRAVKEFPGKFYKKY